MKIVFLTLFITVSIFANTNRITTSDGITCETISESAYEVQSYAEASNNDSDGYSGNSLENSKNNQQTVGIKFIYKFGKPKSLDCKKLYNLELRQKEAKVKELEEKIKALQISNKIDWKE